MMAQEVSEAGHTADTAPPSYVYVIKCEGLVKIGHSRNPEKRLVALRGGSPKEMYVALKFEVPGHLARRVEMDAHYHLANDCVGGEWFKVSIRTAQRAIIKAMGTRIPYVRPSREEVEARYEQLMGKDRKTCIAQDRNWLRKRKRVLA